mmetsp:Transcript_9615/g.35002  ORF Transcript_9615/g.35002 Transcript_9615/m.35002 type:complete len:247 (-) Transcript_9615:1344-2084(-)
MLRDPHHPAERCRPGRRPGRRRRASAASHRSLREASHPSRAPRVLRNHSLPRGLPQHRAHAETPDGSFVRVALVIRVRGGADAHERAGVQRRGLADLRRGGDPETRVHRGDARALPRSAAAVEVQVVRVLRRAGVASTAEMVRPWRGRRRGRARSVWSVGLGNRPGRRRRRTRGRESDHGGWCRVRRQKFDLERPVGHPGPRSAEEGRRVRRRRSRRRRREVRPEEEERRRHAQPRRRRRRRRAQT